MKSHKKRTKVSKHGIFSYPKPERHKPVQRFKVFFSAAEILAMLIGL